MSASPFPFFIHCAPVKIPALLALSRPFRAFLHVSGNLLFILDLSIVFLTLYPNVDVAFPPQMFPAVILR